MSIVYDWPRDLVFRPKSAKMRPVPIGRYSRSPFSGSSNSIHLQHVWQADFSFNARKIADGLSIQGFIDRLESGNNPVRIFDPSRLAPILLASTQYGFSDGTFFTDGTGFTDGYNGSVAVAAAKGASYIVIQGLPASRDVFKCNDLVGINGYLYETKFDMSSNATGQVGLSIRPNLRAGIAVGDVVTTVFPTCEMILLNPAEATIERDGPNTLPFTLSFVENIK